MVGCYAADVKDEAGGEYCVDRSVDAGGNVRMESRDRPENRREGRVNTYHDMLNWRAGYPVGVSW
jgi:hypothetical protein